MPWSECDKSAGNGRVWLPKKLLSLSHGPRTVLLCEQVSTRQRRLHDGPAWLCTGIPTRASAANHREGIGACRRDASVIATANVTSTATPVRNIPALRVGASGEQKSQRKQGAPSAFS